MTFNGPVLIAVILIAIIAFLWLPLLIRYVRHRRAIRRRIGEITVTRRQGGIPARSLCCGAACQPLGWSQDGWIASCRRCGTWQYLGDDHANPPPGFRSDGKPEGFIAGGHIYAMNKDGVRTEVTSGFASGGLVKSSGLREGEVPAILSRGRELRLDELPPSIRRRVEEARLRPGERLEDKFPIVADGEPIPCIEGEFQLEPVPPGGCELCGGELEHTADCPKGVLIDMLPDQDECPREDDLTLPPMPNIGGEGHPDYQGPHYAVPHDRFIPYEMIGDPIPGTAVHKVGNAAFAGPLAVEQTILQEHEQTVETAKSEGNFYEPDADNR